MHDCDDRSRPEHLISDSRLVSVRIAGRFLGFPDTKLFPRFTEDTEPVTIRKDPLKPNEEQKQVELLYGAARLVLDLVIHEDKHNWSKFYGYIYLSAGFVGGIALAMRATDGTTMQVFCLLVSIAGLIVSIGFDVSLNSGIGCLNNHRKHLVAIEERLREDYQMPVVLCNRCGPRRNLLVFAPAYGAVLWIVSIGYWTWLLLANAN